MEHYDLEVCGLKRELPFVKLSDGTAYASFVVISDTELIEKAGKELAAFANGAEIILTIEAKGIALAYEISKQLHMKEFVVVREVLCEIIYPGCGAFHYNRRKSGHFSG